MVGIHAAFYAALRNRVDIKEHLLHDIKVRFVQHKDFIQQRVLFGGICFAFILQRGENQIIDNGITALRIDDFVKMGEPDAQAGVKGEFFPDILQLLEQRRMVRLGPQDGRNILRVILFFWKGKGVE